MGAGNILRIAGKAQSRQELFDRFAPLGSFAQILAAGVFGKSDTSLESNGKAGPASSFAATAADAATQKKSRLGRRSRIVGGGLGGPRAVLG